MFPFVFEWQWDIGHFFFFGLWYLVLTVMGLGLMIVAGKTKKDIDSGADPHH